MRIAMSENSKRQLIAVILGITMFVTLLYSSLFVAKELDHDCEGEHCSICLSIEICVDLMKAACGAVVISFVFSMRFRPVNDRVILFEKKEIYLSPVDLKIRMNN